MEHERANYSLGIIASLIGHSLLLLLLSLRLGNFHSFTPPVVYSVTLEGGKKLGGISQLAKTDKEQQVVPAKKVQEKAAKGEEKKPTEPKDAAKKDDKEKAEVSLAEKNKEKEKEQAKDKKKDEGKDKKGKGESPADINKRLQEAVQRYLGESTDAGGQGFGAGRLGGNKMGGGVLRPPEFFVYREQLMAKLKEGWVWPDTSAALIAQVELDLELDGRIARSELVDSSGNREFDDSVMRAVNKASPVPPPPASVYQFFKRVRVIFDPRE